MTLTGPGRSGEVTWDDELGKFVGTDADELNICAAQVPSHPAFPAIDATAEHDPRAVAILLHIWGWDVPPELSKEVKDWLKGQDDLPSGSVA